MRGSTLIPAALFWFSPLPRPIAAAHPMKPNFCWAIITSTGPLLANRAAPGTLNCNSYEITAACMAIIIANFIRTHLVLPVMATSY